MLILWSCQHEISIKNHNKSFILSRIPKQIKSQFLTIDPLFYGCSFQDSEARASTNCYMVCDKLMTTSHLTHSIYPNLYIFIMIINTFIWLRLGIFKSTSLKTETLRVNIKWPASSPAMIGWQYCPLLIYNIKLHENYMWFWTQGLENWILKYFNY